MMMFFECEFMMTISWYDEWDGGFLWCLWWWSWGWSLLMIWWWFGFILVNIVVLSLWRDWEILFCGSDCIILNNLRSYHIISSLSHFPYLLSLTLYILHLTSYLLYPISCLQVLISYLIYLIPLRPLVATLFIL